jgi:hypothetical protein
MTSRVRPPTTPSGTSTAAESRGRTAVRVILANRRYTGQPVWSNQPKSELLIDLNDVALGHATNQAWNEPGK